MKFLEWFSSVIKGIGGKNPGEVLPLAHITVDLPTGYTNMKNKDLLIQSQDKVWASGAFMPNDSDGEDETFCNLATQAVLKMMGCTDMTGLNADAMMEFLRTSGDWLIKPIGDCQFLANTGTLLIAGLGSKDLGQRHGHVCTITPGTEEFSGHWNCKVPVALSIGRRAICARSLGVNYAFVPMPEFYAWKPSL